jgi:hypothetical protein
VVGCFTYKTKNSKNYIYRNVPRVVWQGFINAESPVGFYNENLKSSFVLVLDE